MYGNVGVFDEKVESFEHYRDRVDSFMSANSIDQAKWTDLFQSIIGPAAFKLLLKLTRTCRFKGFLQEALRDRLVSGLHPKIYKTQCHLLAMRDLSFQTAREKCVADELGMKANGLYTGTVAKGDP